jgi:uncharacterized membrane protein YhfC
MISNASMTFMIISAVVSFLFPVVVFIYLQKNERAVFKPVFIGIITFIIFSQVLEKLLHYVVISNKVFSNPIVFSIYVALAAGVFEEVGRFIMYKSFLKKTSNGKVVWPLGLGMEELRLFCLGD